MAVPARLRLMQADSFLRVCAVSAVLAVAACEQPNSPAASAPSVTVAQPLVKHITEWDEYTGRLAAVDSVEVRARVSGYLESTHFTEGTIVKVDDLLFVIDERPFRIALNRAEAELDRANIQLSLARTELTRANKLIKSRAVSQEELDTRTQAEQQALASVEVAKAARASAVLDLEYASVRAPVSGRIGRREVTPGNLVEGGDRGSTLLTTIVSLDPIHVLFTANERAYLEFQRLKRNLSGGEKIPVEIRLTDEQDYLHRGHLDFIDNEIDAETATILGRALLPNPELFLTPGLFASVRVQGQDRPEALLIPDAAIGSDQSEKYVYVVDDEQTVFRRPVMLGKRRGELRVIEHGLDPQDYLIIKGVQRVRDGAKVSPEPTEILDPESESLKYPS